MFDRDGGQKKLQRLADRRAEPVFEASDEESRAEVFVRGGAPRETFCLENPERLRAALLEIAGRYRERRSR